MQYLVIGLVVVLAILIFRHFGKSDYLTILTEEQFREGYRQAQLIDVREPQEFEKGHILGARNIPMSQMKQSLDAIRPDKPVYLYCQGKMISNRAARLLHKNKYKDINQLKGGFKQWTGRIR